ncbi:class I SAM-dependent methyltransferase [Streptomyces albofaciens JCM 4342]|uniref:class I SAM-dependent methyltransferase n=1 Tax=Streptomyces albofaciens TaxID=66866 RepID=UPI00123AEEFE|nr:class I SAM-dependent methyltransferase [Streptomyces albofaciens]KAA6213068.1 class I SAM-dependent methyltransferase [Streptomyces albofaciens JCM 4342]
MTGSSQYLRAWEGFWRDAPEGEGEVFWDSDPSLTAELHLPLFAAHFDAALPVVDLGCGNGTQTRFLARHYPRAVGVDLSAAAVAHARAGDPAGVAEYRRLDAADPAAVRALHGELGDVNVYLRGVLHQCASEDRPLIVANIATLLGRRGRIFAVEPAEASRDVFASLARRPEGPPGKLRAVLAHGIAPGEMADSVVPGLLAGHGLREIASGRLPLMTTEYLADGSRIEIPTNWLVAGVVD